MGAFGLSLENLPRNPAQGWCLGTSCAPTSSAEVDLLLAPPLYRRTETQIAGHHATFNLHTQSCRIVVQARHTVLVGRNGPKAFRSPEFVLLQPGEIVFIGNCAYTFEYTEYFETVTFKQHVTRFMRQHHYSMWSMNKYISPGSVGHPTQLGNYFCSPRAFNQGTFGKISVGWNKNGGTVAIKTFKDPKEAEIRSHVELMKTIGQHVRMTLSDKSLAEIAQENILHLLECVSNLDTKVPDAYCVYSPLTSANLSDVIVDHTPDSIARDISPGNLAVTSLQEPRGVILDLDAATISVTSTDHIKGTLLYLAPEIMALKQWDGAGRPTRPIALPGIMHRDISPGNLAVTSLQEPRGVILDLDAATISVTSTDHMKGTLPYLAPEIMALKQWDGAGRQPPPYGKSIDTWALGLIMYALYTGQLFDWTSFSATRNKMTPKAFANFRERLGKYTEYTKSPEARAALAEITTMTAWKGRDRRAAVIALDTLLQLRRNQTRGSIMPKTSNKRPREDSED
ncbi:MAG: hypothetical protein L6R38_001178 [Xanthoria sp. 2 TBL-2021]|nr:MAG: hypothetical protein L6R38_001178 [Xanthoria sp. 2 TBL-2021]